MKEYPLATWLLAFLSLVCAGFILYLLRGPLFPLVLAVLVSFGFKPLVHSLRARKIPTAIVVLVVLLCVAGIFAGFSLLLVSEAQSVAEAFPVYQGKLTDLSDAAFAQLDKLANRYGMEVAPGKMLESIDVSSIAQLVASGLSSVVSITGDLMMTLLFLVFLLIGSQDFPGKIERAFPPDVSARMREVLGSIDRGVRQYLVTKTIISLATGLVVTVILLLFRVDFAVSLGLLAFMLNYIPNIGSFVAVVAALLVTIVQFESVAMTLVIGALLIVVQNLVGNVIEPRLMGAKLDLSPLVILVALILWGWLWGVWGMFIAVPITTVVKIICANIRPLKPFAILLGGSPPREKG
jgi:predicted PurR-regulated permease PerM